jgi:hypothetical protein
MKRMGLWLCVLLPYVVRGQIPDLLRDDDASAGGLADFLENDPELSEVGS